MSFALTTAQVLARCKTVTRRTGWQFAKPGDLIQPVEKAQGLKKGETVKPIGGPIRIVAVSRERLSDLIGTSYGKSETAKEGFPAMSGLAFVRMFCDHNGIEHNAEVTRLEFEYVEASS